MDLTIRPTTESDLPDVLSVLDEAAAWLHSTGMTEQWPRVISADAVWVPRLTKLTSEGRMYLAFAGGATVGTFHLRDEPGLDGDAGAWWWPEGQLLATPSVYLFALAVRRAVAGRGVAAAMLGWAFEAAKARGRVLRLDCWAGNQKLRRYYADAGFVHLGDVAGEASDSRFYEVSRFQRGLDEPA